MPSLDKRQQFSFTWGFDGGDATALIKTCTPITLFANRDAEENGTAAQPVPPYTLIAYPERGTPTVDLLGTTAPYTWTPRFPAGTKILISVVDAVGNSGGIAQTTYVVNAGTSTSCIPASSNSGVQMTISTGDTIQTCDTVPIHIQGGNQPYHLSIASTNSASAVNLTTTGSNDYYQWINRAAPGQSLIVAVSDSNGQYATTSKFYTTAGATDTSCPGKSDSQSVFGGGSSSPGGGSNTATSASSASSSTTTAATSTAHKSKSLTGPIVGTIIALLIVFAAIAFWFFRKQKSRSNYDHGPITGSTGFGMKDYKRGENLPGNESFVPLTDNASPVVPVTPLYGGDHAGGHSASGSFSGRPGQRPVSGFDYYSSPPSNYSGTVDSSGPSRMNTLSVSHGTSSSGRSGAGSAYGAAAVGATAGAAATAAATATAAAHHSKRQMMLEEQQRQQRWPGANYVPPPPQSVYPPQSMYSADPFADPTYPQQPYRMGPTGVAPSVVVSEAVPPPSNTGSGYGYRPEAPTTYKASHTSRASGSQDGSVSSAAKAKAAEAAREREQQQQRNVPSTIYDDDEDPIPYMQRSRPVLGVTNPDRASTATGNSATDDAYGGMDPSRPPTQVYQHEDAGAVIELPPAYREYQGGASEAGHGGNNAPRRPS